jgi:hypothetical protein
LDFECRSAKCRRFLVVQTNDPSSLTVTTPWSFAGAAELQINEIWTNADGTKGSASIADNVEAYAPGSPIFALSGDDNLTGAGRDDMFVFSRPIGNDRIYNFNSASDKIDRIGVALAISKERSPRTATVIPSSVSVPVKR